MDMTNDIWIHFIPCYEQNVHVIALKITFL